MLLARTAAMRPIAADAAEWRRVDAERASGARRGAFVRRVPRRARLVRRRARADALFALDHAAQRAAPLQHALLLRRRAARASSRWRTQPRRTTASGSRRATRSRAIGSGRCTWSTRRSNISSGLSAFDSLDAALALRSQQADRHDHAARDEGRLRDSAAARGRVVTLVRAPNPSAMTLTGTNSYLVDCGNGAALVDRSGPRDHAARRGAARRGARAQGLAIRAIALTHGHPDHVAAAPELAAATGAPGLRASAERDAAHADSAARRRSARGSDRFARDRRTGPHVRPRRLLYLPHERAASSRAT